MQTRSERIDEGVRLRFGAKRRDWQEVDERINYEEAALL